MPGYRYIALDSYPLTNAAIVSAKPGKMPSQSEQCHQWLLDCEAAGRVLLVPAISYYEGVRNLYQRQATASILDALSNWTAIT